MGTCPENATASVVNPFPGLRAFEPDEDHLFFGRDRQTDELMSRLRTSHFLAVVGGSGSGKSSLVKSGLVPNLHRGYMAKAGSHWRVAILRPGEDPLRNLAAALAAPEVLGGGEQFEGLPLRAIIEATLRSGSGGLVNAIGQAQLPEADNVLVVVDQFEELFRFQTSRSTPAARNEALAFVKLLLAATELREIFVCLTMRSEYVGDCLDYPGLPEAVNAGQFLVPRMSRDELRLAVTGPVAVGGGRIAPGLVTRLLNDAGEAAHQLPVLQHALMRTWDHWQSRTGGEGEITIDDYEAIGTMQEALSRHAEEAFAELSSDRQRLLARRIFQALTDTSEDERGVRRPTSVAELCQLCAAELSEVDAVIERFRRQGRAFLLPPPGVPLEPASIVDLSHEALMRIWERLREWTAQEKESAALYRRLAQSAELHARGDEGLWRNPQLRLAVDWCRRQQPNAAWADRYGGSFDQAHAFLKRSARAQRLRRGTLYGALTLLLLTILFGVSWRAHLEQQKAQAEAQLSEERARKLQEQVDELLEKNPQLAQEAVSLRTENRELSLRILEVAAENRDLEQQKKALEVERQALGAKQARQKGAITRLEGRQAALEASLRELEVNEQKQEVREDRISAELNQLLEENGALRARAIEKGVVVLDVDRYVSEEMALAELSQESVLVAQEGATPLSPETAEVEEDPLEKRLEQLLQENLLLKMTAAELRQEKHRLQAKLQPLEEAGEQLKSEVAALQVKTRALAAENAQLEKNRATLAASVKKLQARKTNLEVKVRASRYRVARLKQLIQVVQEENEALRRILEKRARP